MRSVSFLALLLLAACDDPIPQTVGGAMQAYSQNRVAEAEAVYRRIAADPAASAADKAEAHRQLGRIAWLVDGDSGRALAEVKAAFAVGDDRCSSGRLTARILNESGRGEALLRQTAGLAAACDEPGEADEIRLSAAAAAIGLGADGRKDALPAAAALIAETGEDSRSSLPARALALHLSLLQGDPAGALQAWRDYFWLSGTDVPQGLAAAFPEGASIFLRGLAPGSTPEAKLRLVELLVHAGFARQAESFARSNRLAQLAPREAAWRRASAYFEARRALEAALLNSNRRVARGGSSADMEELLKGFETRLMAAAGISGDRREGLLRAYGLYSQWGETDGHPSIHLGHAVQRDRRRVEQYGHGAEVAFIALDNMLANGFNSWLWDGAAAAGGWTEEGPVIVQVRPEYTSTPLSGWSLHSGGARRQRLLRRAPERTRTDLEALREAEVAYLPGLADRLSLQVADQVGRRARALAGTAGDLRRAFLAEYWRASFQQSIFLHEGRHALDRTLVRGLARFFDDDLEYRAKLSELALADYPRLALFQINSDSIGGDSGHARGNRRVLQGYVDWIRAHPGEIAGYDPRRPPLVQLDKLSDSQLRAVARSLDPIARR